MYKPTPKLRTDAKNDLHGALHGAIAGAIGSMFNLSNYPFQTCLNCANFKEVKEQCGLWNDRPPARVIAFGCDKWKEEDRIPY